MKMKQIMAAAAAAGMLTFGAVMGASAAGIGYVNTNALMQAHPKMEKARLDMRAAAQKAEQDFAKQSEGKTDAEKQQIAAELQKKLGEKTAPSWDRSYRTSRKPFSRYASRRAWTSSLIRLLSSTAAWTSRPKWARCSQNNFTAESRSPLGGGGFSCADSGAAPGLRQRDFTKRDAHGAVSAALSERL